MDIVYRLFVDGDGSTIVQLYLFNNHLFKIVFMLFLFVCVGWR